MKINHRKDLACHISEKTGNQLNMFKRGKALNAPFCICNINKEVSFAEQG